MREQSLTQQRSWVLNGTGVRDSRSRIDARRYFRPSDQFRNVSTQQASRGSGSTGSGATSASGTNGTMSGMGGANGTSGSSASTYQIGQIKTTQGSTGQAAGMAEATLPNVQLTQLVQQGYSVDITSGASSSEPMLCSDLQNALPPTTPAGSQ